MKGKYPFYLGSNRSSKNVSRNGPGLPVTTKWEVVGNVDTAPWVWIVVAVVVVALIAVLLLSGGRRRKAMQEKRDQENREKAAEIRRKAENMELDARERE